MCFLRTYWFICDIIYMVMVKVQVTSAKSINPIRLFLTNFKNFIWWCSKELLHLDGVVVGSNPTLS